MLKLILLHNEFCKDLQITQDKRYIKVGRLQQELNSPSFNQTQVWRHTNRPFQNRIWITSRLEV